jgi:hypothetical protein
MGCTGETKGLGCPARGALPNIVMLWDRAVLPLVREAELLCMLWAPRVRSTSWGFIKQLGVEHGRR